MRNAATPRVTNHEAMQRRPPGYRVADPGQYFIVTARSAATKQSMLSFEAAMDCFAALAMTAKAGDAVSALLTRPKTRSVLETLTTAPPPRTGSVDTTFLYQRRTFDVAVGIRLCALDR
jgi:hypothetical protein